jgi:hypothetical protein
LEDERDSAKGVYVNDGLWTNLTLSKKVAFGNMVHAAWPSLLINVRSASTGKKLMTVYPSESQSL